jgi:hypothetical protein
MAGIDLPDPLNVENKQQQSLILQDQSVMQFDLFQNQNGIALPDRPASFFQYNK